MIKTEEKNRIEIVSFSEKNINALVADKIREEINKVISNSNPRIIVDLHGVEYIDSTGFGSFLSLMKAAKNSYGVLKFAAPEPAVIELIDKLNLRSVFEVFEVIESCIKSFSNNE